MIRTDSNIAIKKLSDLMSYKMGYLAGLTYMPQLLKIINDKEIKNKVVTGYSLQAMFSQLLAPIPFFDIIADANTLC